MAPRTGREVSAATMPGNGKRVLDNTSGAAGNLRRFMRRVPATDRSTGPVNELQEKKAEGLLGRMKAVVGDLKKRTILFPPTKDEGDRKRYMEAQRMAAAYYLDDFFSNAHAAALGKGARSFADFLTALEGAVDLLEGDYMGRDFGEQVIIFNTTLKAQRDTCAELFGVESLNFSSAIDMYSETVGEQMHVMKPSQ